ncbi:transposase [Deinococcus radiopugnans]|uniref:transposase n=1 Tax=Deinococcus radiopugnans TaxID=57497 RepID=UPI003609F24E
MESSHTQNTAVYPADSQPVTRSGISRPAQPQLEDVRYRAPFHKGAKLKEKAAAWEKKGLYLRYLPPYAPFLNLIEGVWRTLKGILLPRRCYNSVAELRAALLTGLKVLGTRFI